MTAPVVTWQGCYDASWRGAIVPEAFAHPAKMSRGLIERIFAELFDVGALVKGAVCVDPFGGIGTTGLEGARHGVQVYCCELEPRFVALAEANFALRRPLWEAQGRPLPVIVQGDSRHLRAALAPVMADAVVSSPPYVVIASGAGGLNTKPPKHAGQQGGRSASSASQDTDQRYGASDGQLARMPEGCVDAVVSSPPFATGDTASAQSITTRSDKSAAWVKANCGSAATQGYGEADGQLGVMARGNVADALVSSPPYEGRLHAGQDGIDWDAAKSEGGSGGHQAPGVSAAAAYPVSRENLGNVSGDTFWMAARDIVAESYAILKPGGVAVWVVKRYVKHKQIVDFPDDWRRLCEHVGFETVLEARASLVQEDTRMNLFGESTTRRRERKSFFRRLAEKHGSPRIDWETVLFMRKGM